MLGSCYCRGAWLFCAAVLLPVALLTIDAASSGTLRTADGLHRQEESTRTRQSRQLLGERPPRGAAGGQPDGSQASQGRVSKLRVRSRARSADGAKSGVMGRMIDRNKLSVPKWGKVSADLESRCRQQGNLSSVPHLRSVDGMHLTYPDTWKGVDFIFHKDYGLQAGQKHPGLVNKVTSSLMDELSHVLIPQAEFKNQHDTSSCAVVYSSEQALHDSKFGDAIDKHKTVFRFGQFDSDSRMTSFSDIGAKTTFRVFTMMQCLKLLEMRGTGKRQNILNLEKDLTILMFNSKATTESAMKGFIVMYVRLRNALKEAGRRDVSVHLISPLAYLGAKMLSLDTVKCLSAGGACGVLHLQGGLRSSSPNLALNNSFCSGAPVQPCNSVWGFYKGQNEEGCSDVWQCSAYPCAFSGC